MANDIYFNSRAKSLEAKLLGFDKLSLLASCKTVEDAKKLLNEWEFLKGFQAKTFSDFLELVVREQKDFLRFLQKETPNTDISKFFCLRFDYFNLEATFLEKQFARPFDLFPEGMILHSTLRQAFSNKEKQKLLPPRMQKVLAYVENLFQEQKQTGFLLDTAFKKAQYADMLDASACDKTLNEFMNALVDLKNIELCFRFRDTKVFRETRLDGGTLDENFFEMLCEKPIDLVLSKTKSSPYYVALKLLAEAMEQNQPFSKFEFLVDCFGETFFDDFKHSVNKNYAYIRYCFLKQNEITNLRIVFEGLQAQRNHKKICDDLRRIYAK